MASDGEVTIIIQSLERISDRLDRHDDKFDGIVATLQQLIKIDTEQRELRGALDRAFKRIEVLEHTHNEQGCPMFRAMEEKRENTIKAIDKEKEEITKRLKELEDKPKMRIENLLKGFFVAAGGGAFTWLITHWKG